MIPQSTSDIFNKICTGSWLCETVFKVMKKKKWIQNKIKRILKCEIGNILIVRIKW